ncbi:hypothetical protein RB195_006276 [Necator americanus]|uniref:Uncharacterized protein n=1 Tax=Necator americanus TaxID=51031 RepID=A0ABR1BTB4_NECAM
MDDEADTDGSSVELTSNEDWMSLNSIVKTPFFNESDLSYSLHTGTLPQLQVDKNVYAPHSRILCSQSPTPKFSSETFQKKYI